MTNRRLTATLAAAAVAAAGLAPAIASAGTVSPGTGGPMSSFFIKAPVAPVEDAEANGGSAFVTFTAPKGSPSKCGMASPASDYGVRGGKAVFDVEPQRVKGGKWCKGTYKLKVVVDQDGAGSLKTIATGSAKVR